MPQLLLGNRLYDFLTYVVQIGLPALGTLYFTVAQIWGLPGGEEVVGTIVAVATFLGVLLKLSSASYNHSDARYDGAIEITEVQNEDGELKKLFSLNLDGDPMSLENRKAVTFKIDAH